MELLAALCFLTFFSFKSYRKRCTHFAWWRGKAIYLITCLGRVMARLLLPHGNFTSRLVMYGKALSPLLWHFPIRQFWLYSLWLHLVSLVSQNNWSVNSSTRGGVRAAPKCIDVTFQSDRLALRFLCSQLLLTHSYPWAVISSKTWQTFCCRPPPLSKACALW